MTGGEGLDRDDIGIVVAGVVTFGAAILPWYESRDGVFALTGWGLGAVAVVAVLAAMYAAGRVVLMRGRPQKPEVPVTPQAETFVATALALVLMIYRVLDAPTIAGRPAVRTTGLIVAALAVLVQFVFAARKIGRTGVRAK